MAIALDFRSFRFSSREKFSSPLRRWNDLQIQFVFRFATSPSPLSCHRSVPQRRTTPPHYPLSKLRFQFSKSSRIFDMEPKQLDIG